MSVPIVIDNGSYQCRAGFANEEQPRLVFKNLLAKLRKERGKKDVEIQVGNEIDNLDNVRFALKSQFDRNVVIYMDVQETILDYLFAALNLSQETSIDHPILLSEAFLNPNYCRHLMTELMFECYQVPSIAYGTDALFSFQNNFPQTKDALIISLGFHTIHVLPFLDGKVDPVNCRRVNVGGYEVSGFMHRVLQLKYPAHVNSISLGKVEDILQEKGYIALDYMEELSKWMNVDFYNEHVLRLQLPTKPQTSAAQTEITKEKRKETARRMVEMNAKKREEKLAEDEERLEILNEIKTLAQDGGDCEEVQRALRAAGVTSMEELIKAIGALKSRIYKAKNRSKPEPSSSSCSQPEAQKKASKDCEYPKDQEKFQAWISKMRTKRVEILKKRALRRQKRSDMAKRRTAAAQERMRILSQLARKEKKDTFGMRDEDWDVYKAIQKDGGGSDSEDEQEELNELEQVLKTHDPSFLSEIQTEAKGRSEDHELHVGLESVRSPELLFQPSMMGESQAGLTETVEHVLKLFPADIQLRLVSNVFLTGGPAIFTGLVDRVEKELLQMRPFQSSFKVHRAQNPLLDTWYGMRQFAVDGRNRKYFVTKSEFEEKGGEYFKEHSASNKYFPSPHMSMESTNISSSVTGIDSAL
ncbi:unnamed protein product [Allacma fusca]|uniref:Actin-related protein 5 n=1 Tax=Allacma fusca TaxID=39272 RepID=A0A8J2KBY6_9HEXA|nr:unnamed protein product [Allacma fusca]